MKNYRILQIHNFYQIPGGEDVVVRNEKRLLEEHGHKVYTYYRSNSELAKKGIVGKLFLPFTAVFSLKTYQRGKKADPGEPDRHRACTQHADDGQPVRLLRGIPLQGAGGADAA